MFSKLYGMIKKYSFLLYDYHQHTEIIKLVD